MAKDHAVPVMAKDYAVPVMAKDHVVRVMAKDYAAPATSTLHAALSVLVGRVLAGRVLAGIWVLKTQNAMPRRSKDNANFWPGFKGSFTNSGLKVPSPN